MTMREAKREIVHGLQALIQYAHEWKAKCEAAEQRTRTELSRVDRAETEAASLRAEHRKTWERMRLAENESLDRETRLAAAIKLLERYHEGTATHAEVDAFLANAPAAPTRIEGSAVYKAECAVLRVVRENCRDSRMWMQANMWSLWIANDVLQRAVEDRESSRRMKCQECGNAEGVHDSGYFGILCKDVAACNQRCVDAWYAAEVERMKDRSPA
jgi:hypothetical protein